MADDLARALGRLEGEVRALRESLDALVAAHEQRLADHSRRLRALERWRAWLAGVGAALVALVGYGLRR